MCKDKSIDSEREAPDEAMRRSIQESINDSGIDIDAETVFDRITRSGFPLLTMSDEEQFIP
ncbi:hypothetical protein [Rhizobium sp. BE258]|jgi:hypothetical protein|uniref:hypothetical protein n=1 Tax=Rhizobium sp. BE258 TaxID=2817722 RepID=UPI0028543806|nr:hypothetical protein [Rhizobium sp. BE258]MDR7143054.1 hypothetical protein [Rhizobium sp. BE258]